MVHKSYWIERMIFQSCDFYYMCVFDVGGKVDKQNVMNDLKIWKFL